MVRRDGAHVIIDQAIPLRFVLHDREPAHRGIRIKEEAAVGPRPQAAVAILEDRKHLEALVIFKQRVALPRPILVVDQPVARPGPDAAVLRRPQRQRSLADQRALAQGLPAVRLPAPPDATARHTRHQIPFRGHGKRLDVGARYRRINDCPPAIEVSQPFRRAHPHPRRPAPRRRMRSRCHGVDVAAGQSILGRPLITAHAIRAAARQSRVRAEPERAIGRLRDGPDALRWQTIGCRQRPPTAVVLACACVCSEPESAIMRGEDREDVARGNTITAEETLPEAACLALGQRQPRPTVPSKEHTTQGEGKRQ